MSENFFSLNRSAAYLRRRAGENRRAGRLGEAATLLHLAMEAEYPPAPALLSDYSELLSSVGLYEASDELLYEMLQTGSEEEQGACFYALGENAYAQGEMRRAMDYLSIFLDGECADEAYNHALDLLENAQTAASAGPVKRGEGEPYAQRLVTRALDQMRDGYGQNAMRMLRRANHVHRTADAYSLMAICAMAQGELGAAQTCCRKALRLKPDSVRVLCTLTCAYAAQGRKNMMQRTLIKALRACKNEQDDLAVGQCAADLGLHHIVQLCCGRVRRKTPYHPMASQMYAIACVNTGRLRRASRVWGAMSRMRGEDTVLSFYDHFISDCIEENRPELKGLQLPYGYQVPGIEVQRRLIALSHLFASSDTQAVCDQFEKDAALRAQVKWLLYLPSSRGNTVRAAMAILGRVGSERAKRMLLCMLLSDVHSDEQKQEALSVLSHLGHQKPCFAYLHGALVRAIPQGEEAQQIPQGYEQIIQMTINCMGVDDHEQAEKIMRIWTNYAKTLGEHPDMLTHSDVWPLALEWAYGKIEGKKITAREIARREGVPSRLIKRLGRRILSANKERE